MAEPIQGPRAVDLVVRGAAVVTMNAERDVVLDGAVAVADSRIVAVGKAADIVRDHDAARTIDIPGGLLTPGMVDGHNHPHDFLLRGLLTDIGHWPERARHLLPFEQSVTEEEAYIGARATFANMLRTGTTTVCDAGSAVPDGVARAAVDTGIRATLARNAADTVGFANAPDGATREAIVDRAAATVERWHGAADGRIRARFSLDHPFSVSDDLCAAVVERAAALGTGILGHFHGSTADQYKGGRNPHVQRYESLGVMTPDTVLAHIGWLPPEDIEIFTRTGVGAVHCPMQTFAGAQGMTGHGSIPELIAAGVPVALGTDAACISDSLDLVRAMHATGAHRDARMDPFVLGAHKAFEMATIDGATALNLADEIGSLEPGKRADLVLFDTRGPEWQPWPLASPISRLVYSATGGSVHTVVVDGSVVLEDGSPTTHDEEAIGRETADVSLEVHQRLGIGVRDRLPWPIR